MSQLVYILEDDAFLAQSLKETLADLLVDCKTFPSVHSFEAVFPGSEPDHLIVDLAVPLAGASIIDAESARAGHRSGIALIRAAKKTWARCMFTVMTGAPSEDVRTWCEANGVAYIIKPVCRLTLERRLGLRKIRAFVVHGRDAAALGKTKDILAALGVEPVVLMEHPNKGQTVIEKFEAVSSACDCAFVALSPDDIGALAGAASPPSPNRARQNVIFELGFFCGALGRKSGRVVILEYGDCEIPSDLAGIIRLDGTRSIAELTADISAELEDIIT